MAREAYTPRLATARLFLAQLDCLRRTAGLLIKATRDFRSPARPPDKQTQHAVAEKADVGRGLVIALEQGGAIPASPNLGKILRAAGFRMQKGTGGHALRQLLARIRDLEDALALLPDEKPN